MEESVKSNNAYNDEVLNAFFKTMDIGLDAFIRWALYKYSREYRLCIEDLLNVELGNVTKESIDGFLEQDIEGVESMLDLVLQLEDAEETAFYMARHIMDDNFRSIELSIDNILSSNERVAIAKIREISRWIIKMIDITGQNEGELFGGVVDSPSSIQIKFVEDLLNNEIDSTDKKLSFILDLVESCRVFYSFFATKCEDFGYDLKEILLNTQSLTFYEAQDSEARKTSKSIVSPLAPIDEIIIFQDSQIAKDIIKSVMKGKKGKGASIAIRALLKAKVISQKEFDRVVIYRAIEELIGATIGTESGVNRYWNDDTLERQINLIVKDIERQLAV